MTARRILVAAGLTVAITAVTLGALCLAADRWVTSRRLRWDGVDVWSAT